MEDINRLKAVLAEQKRTSRWLANELGVTPLTVSKWCTTILQTGLEILARIVVCLDVRNIYLIREPKDM